MTDESFQELDEKYWALRNEVVSAQDLMDVPNRTIMVTRDGLAAQKLGPWLMVVAMNDVLIVSLAGATDAVRAYGPLRVVHVFEKEFTENDIPEAL